MFLILVSMVFFVGLLYLLLYMLTADVEHCVDWHRRKGTHQVFYPDYSQFSQPFTRKVAKDYAKIFKGTVVPYGFEHENNPFSKIGRAKVEAARAQREKEEWG